MTEPPASRVTPAHLLCVYAEALAAGRRVLVVGDSASDVGSCLTRIGARVVHVYDPVAGRAASAHAARGVVARDLPDGEFDVRDGAFDLAIVPEIELLANAPALLARLRRIVGHAGAVLVSARNPERAGASAAGGRSLDYYELYDLASLQFPTVRMIGQVPFAGVAIAELGESAEDPQVSFDTQLVPEPDAPEYFYALASHNDARLEAYAIVQTPGAPAPPEREEDRETVTALAEAQLRADLLEVQLDEERARFVRLAADGAKSGDQTTAKMKDAEARASDHHLRAERLAAELTRLEGELERAQEGTLRLSRALEEERAARARSEQALVTAQANPDLPASRDRVRALEEALAVAGLTIAALEEAVALAASRKPPVEIDLTELSSAHAAELAEIEERLRERAQAVRELEREVQRRERIVQDLLSSLALGDATSDDAVAAEMTDLRAKLDALALENARREGELQSRKWKIDQLEGELVRARAQGTAPARAAESAVGAAPPQEDLKAKLARAEDEIDILKKAMIEEHQARLQARAEIERQTALIEKLSRELDAGDRLAVAEDARES